ncbi:MAG: MJ0042-type zinc finger domain-containing protein [Candidatus Odinarchaeota archaeon]
MSYENQNGYRLKCPSCNATYWYKWEKIDEYGSVDCQNCAMRIFVDSFTLAEDTMSQNVPDAIVPSRKPFLTLTTSEGIRVKCPHCSAQYVYKDSQKMEDGRLRCQNCNNIIDAIGSDVLVYQAPVEKSKSEDTAILCIILTILLFVPPLVAVPIVICIVALRLCNPAKTEEQDTFVYTEGTQGLEPR